MGSFFQTRFACGDSARTQDTGHRRQEDGAALTRRMLSFLMTYRYASRRDSPGIFLISANLRYFTYLSSARIILGLSLRLKAAILVHHGETDKRLVEGWPAYDSALTAAGVTHGGYIYPGAGHGFHCDATPERYRKAVADLAWQRTVDWFEKYVR